MFGFIGALYKDKTDLQNQSLSEKFSVVVSAINKAAFNGYGTVTVLNKRSFNLYEDGQNQIINFFYSTGHLTITWKYKYFQKEVVHERKFNDVRNITIFQQNKIAEQMISEMDMIVARHQASINRTVDFGVIDNIINDYLDKED